MTDDRETAMDHTDPPSILVVDDNPDNLRLLAGILKDRGFIFRPARDGQTALNSAISNLPDLILLDILMPEMDGYEVCRRLKAEPATRDVPVIFISALDDSFDKVSAFSSGGIDYVTKPFSTEELMARIETHLSLRRARLELVEKNMRLEREIRERQRAEATAKAGEKRFATVMNSMQAVMYVADMETYELLFINRYTRELFGDVEGQICWQVFQNRQKGPCPFCTNRYLIKNGVPTGDYHWEFRNTITNRWYQIQNRAIHWSDGRLVRLEIALDIDRLKKTETALRIKNEYMKALHETSLKLMHRLDIDDLLKNILDRAVSLANVSDGFIHLFDFRKKVLKIRFAAGGFKKYLGYCLKPGEGLAGKVWQSGNSMLINNYMEWPGRDRNIKFDSIRSILGVPLFAENRVQGVIGLAHSETDRTISQQDVEILNHFARMASLALDNAFLYQSMTQEIAVRKKAEQAAEAANSAKSDFIARMNHELRTPLNAIMGYAQLYTMQPDTEPKHSKAFQSIYKSGNHLLTLIGDIMDLSKVEAGKTELRLRKTDLQGMIRDVVSLIQMRAKEKEIEVRWNSDESLPDRILADEKCLKQILINLLGNAVKFTDTGRVILRVQNLIRASDSCRIRFEVEDTGIGIAPEALERIFSPFEQTGDFERRNEGAGLGLAISRQLVRLMGGDIRVESEPNRGSRFRFELDFTVLPDTFRYACEREASPVCGYSGARKRILIIDSDLSSREFFAETLESLGFDVETAAGGEEAGRKVRETKADAVLLDTVTADSIDSESLEKMRKAEGPEKPRIIAVSSDAVDTADMKNREFDAFLQKPVRLERLYDLLGALLSLEWVYKEGRPGGGEEACRNQEMIPPPAEDLEMLYETAYLGVLDRLKDQADGIAEKNPEYAPFVNRLKALADAYELDRLFTLIEKYLNQ